MQPIDLYKQAKDGYVFNDVRYNLDQTAIEDAINNLISSATAGNSGAENLKSAPIPQLVGSNIYTLLCSLKAYTENLIEQVMLGQIAAWSIKDFQVNPDELAVTVDNTSKDATSGVYTKSTYNRKSDNSKYLYSEFTNPDANHYYQTWTGTYYDTDGITVLKIVTKAITYDADGQPLTIT